MGAHISKSNKRRTTQLAEIDLLLDEDYKRSKRECKILLLGGRGSGKSTLVNHLRIIHQGGFTKDELLEYRRFIYQNVVESAQFVVVYMRKMGLECEEPSNKLNMEKILSYCSVLRGGFGTHAYFPPDIAEAITHFATDSVVSKVVEDHMGSSSTLKFSTYFFNNISQIGAPGYVPTGIDVLRAQPRNGGVTETRFGMGQLSMRMIAIDNQRSERKKWLHCFESVTTIVFCAGLSDYDRVMIEDPDESRVSQLIDLFKAEIREVPLVNYFEEYTSGADVNKAAKYILWKFMQLNRTRHSVYPHLIQARDTTNIRLAFAAVRETISQNASRDSSDI